MTIQSDLTQASHPDDSHLFPQDCQPTIRIVATPKDTNVADHIFGGWIMSQMNIAGSIVAVEYANSRVVTVAATSIAVIVYVAVYKEVTPKPLPARGANFSHSF